jgi:4a-hydroxytetrahydrobiopterin dehydratase
MEPLSDPEIDTRLATLDPGWRREGDEIVRERQCADFAAAIELVNAVAAAAELANHHPDILIHGYRNVRITLSTHDADGLTERDFALAQTLDAL